MMNQIGAINLVTLDFIYSNIDKIPDLGEEVSTNALTLSLGGGPVAALATAQRLGAPVKLATSLGTDHISEIARRLLDNENIPFRSFYSPVEGSPVNITSVLTFPNTDRAFVSYFPDTSFYAENSDEIYMYLKNTAFCIASSPSTALFERLRQSGCKIVYDVGWSEQLNIELIADVLRNVYLFSPNEKEALKLTGAPDARSALLRLAEYVKQPIVKLGKDGALVLHEGSPVHVPPTDFAAVDSTGAGDAFLGGVTYGLSQGWNILRCAELGNYTGGKATTQIGCLTARSTLEEFESICQKR